MDVTARSLRYTRSGGKAPQRGNESETPGHPRSMSACVPARSRWFISITTIVDHYCDSHYFGVKATARVVTRRLHAPTPPHHPVSPTVTGATAADRRYLSVRVRIRGEKSIGVRVLSRFPRSVSTRRGGGAAEGSAERGAHGSWRHGEQIGER